MLLVRPGREVRRCSDQWWSAGRAVGDRCARVGGSLQKSCADRGACGGQRPSAESSLSRLASSAGGIRGKRARGNRAPAAIGEWWTDDRGPSVGERERRSYRVGRAIRDMVCLTDGPGEIRNKI
jgi:hypothetical protein